MAKMAATSSRWLPIPMANVPDTAIALTGDAIGHHTDPDVLHVPFLACRARGFQRSDRIGLAALPDCLRFARADRRRGPADPRRAVPLPGKSPEWMHNSGELRPAVGAEVRSRVAGRPDRPDFWHGPSTRPEFGRRTGPSRSAVSPLLVLSVPVSEQWIPSRLFSKTLC